MMEYATTNSPQVVGLRQLVMNWLLDQHFITDGSIRGDMYDIARDTRSRPPEVTKVLWDLRQQGLVAFREGKREGTNGHGSTTVLHAFSLTAKGLDDRHIPVTDRWLPDDSPVGMLVDLLRNGPIRIMDANIRLGYPRQSTAIYALHHANPGGFKVQAGKVEFIGGPDWRPRPIKNPNMSKRRISHTRTVVSPALLKEAQASVALDHDPLEGTQSVPVPDDYPATGAGQGGELADRRTDQQPSTERQPLPQDLTDVVTDEVTITQRPRIEYGPHITALLARAARRAKVAEAIAILEEAGGLEDDALTLMGRIPDDSPLEREMIEYIEATTEWLLK